MTKRREFIKTGGVVAAGISIGYSGISLSPGTQDEFKSKRPPIQDRKFISQAVEECIIEVKKTITDPELSWMFENCFPNTLDTTVEFKYTNGKPDTFVITGDIEAMWLRDSTAQVWPYLPLINQDSRLQELVAGVIHRQTKCILIDPYANAFNNGPTGGEWEKDLTKMKPDLHERKWEIDSLCYPIRLAFGFWKETEDTTCFDEDWTMAMKLVVQTFRQQQRKENRGPYKFQRITAWQTDTVAGAGYGNPIKPNGLICSMFRPSDDATIYPFLIPSNYFAVISLKQLAEISKEVIKDFAFAKECESLAREVEKALIKYARAEHMNYGEVLAYELDGFGNRLYMDDANIPSLLSMPYLNTIEIEDKLYQATRKFVMSPDNPYFFKGKQAEGNGGPHVGLDMIWPMAIIMRAITSNSDEEILQCLKMLKRTHAGTGFMHESFHKDKPLHYTRKWFAWANTLFGELLIKLYKERPHLLGGEI